MKIFRARNKWLRWFLRTFLLLFILANVMAAFHAWKLTHNYPGEGQHAKGPDKMSFGEKATALFFGVKNIKPSISRTPSIPYKTLNLYTKDSLKIESWLIEKDSAIGTVIFFHGHLSTKAGMIDEADAFNKMGYQTMLVDFRAHGSSDGTSCTIGMNESEEVKLAYDYARSLNEKNIILYGSSLGAAAIMRSIYNYDEVKPEKLILDMPFGSLHEAVQGRVKMMGLPKQPVSSLLTFWGGIEHGFWAFNHKPEKYAKHISCPVLLQWGKLDRRVSQSETESIYRNFISKNKRLEIYPDASHEALLKNDSVRWMNTITSFLKE
jgi:alpha-beta hydrolase superfamily lysophospholipase